MMWPVLIAMIVIVAAPTLYFAIRSSDFRKFLAGAFFTSAGIQLYLYFAGVSIPLAGTDFVQTPKLSAIRGIVHSVLFVITFYFAFVRKPAH
jgi:hypothetical protein